MGICHLKPKAHKDPSQDFQMFIAGMQKLDLKQQCAHVQRLKYLRIWKALLKTSTTRSKKR